MAWSRIATDSPVFEENRKYISQESVRSEVGRLMPDVVDIHTYNHQSRLVGMIYIAMDRALDAHIPATRRRLLRSGFAKVKGADKETWSHPSKCFMFEINKTEAMAATFACKPNVWLLS